MSKRGLETPGLGLILPRLLLLGVSARCCSFCTFLSGMLRLGLIIGEDGPEHSWQNGRKGAEKGEITDIKPHPFLTLSGFSAVVWELSLSSGVNFRDRIHHSGHNEEHARCTLCASFPLSDKHRIKTPRNPLWESLFWPTVKRVVGGEHSSLPESTIG